MKHNGESGQALHDLVQDIKAQGRRNQLALLVAGALGGSELVSAVAGADGDSQGVAAGLLHELLDLLGMSVVGLLGRDLHVILDAGQSAQLGLHNHAVVVGVLNHLLGDFNVLSKGLAGGVDHDGGKAAVDAALAGLKVRAVVQMQGDGDVGALDDGRLHQLHQIGVVGVGPGALGHLENQGSLQIPGGLGDALDDLHIVDVERADGIAAVVGFFEHFGRGNQCHKINSCSFICPALPHRPTGPIPVVKKRRFKRTKTIFPYDNITRFLKCKYLQFFF